ARLSRLPVAPPRGEHSTGQHPVDRARSELGIRARGLLAAVSEDRGPLARSRALGDQIGELAGEAALAGLRSRAERGDSSDSIRAGFHRSIAGPHSGAHSDAMGRYRSRSVASRPPRTGNFDAATYSINLPFRRGGQRKTPPATDGNSSVI